MFLKHPFSLIGSALLAPLYFVTAMLETDSEFAISGAPVLHFAILAMSPAAVVFALALPRLRARWFFLDAGFPHFTFVLPRWMICIISTLMLGSSAGLLAAGVVYAVPALALGLMHFISWLAFAYSASIRCQRPATTEFSVPWLPRSALRWR